MTFAMVIPRSMTTTPAEARSTMRALHSELSSVPGVKTLSLTGGSLPMQGDSELPFWIEGQPKPATEKDMNMTLFYIVEPEYLETMGLTLKRGRFFRDQTGKTEMPWWWSMKRSLDVFSA